MRTKLLGSSHAPQLNLMFIIFCLVCCKVGGNNDGTREDLVALKVAVAPAVQPGEIRVCYAKRRHLRLE